MLNDEGFPEGSHIIIGVFPFYNFPDRTEDGNGRIAPFACCNYYKELIHRMKSIIRQAPAPLSKLKKREYRLFCNSTLPEKQMAAEAGLGFIGKNSLLITPEFGSICLIAGMILPSVIPLTGGKDITQTANCGNCTLCSSACPTGALTTEGFNREKCLQNWTTDRRLLPDEIKEKWGNRIYGCTICQDICPKNRKIPEGLDVKRGVIPSGLSLDFLIKAEDDEIRSLLKDSSVGMNWIGPMVLKRNAVLTAGAEKREELRPSIEELSHRHLDESLQDACDWALKKLRKVREL